MLKQIDFREKSVNWTQLMPLLPEIDELPIEPVRDIIKQVRESGDDALRDLTKKFDGILLDEFPLEVLKSLVPRLIFGRQNRPCRYRRPFSRI